MKQVRVFSCDFETTVYDGQEYTEVWAAAIVELNTEEVKIFHSIGEFFEYVFSLDCNVMLFFHNLKFDGEFILYFLQAKLKYRQAIKTENGDLRTAKFLTKSKMPENSYTYSISGMGQWYRMTIRHGKKQVIEIRDSLKLLPFSVKEIGRSFATKHKKLEMEYRGYRYAGCEITPEEKEYIANDVMVVKEALEIMFQEGHTKLTIGSCCLNEYRNMIGSSTYLYYFPNIYKITDPVEGVDNAGEWVRKCYRGGWCYVAKGKENRVFENGCTCDVNSLYSYVMSSASGNRYPIGKPTFWNGNFIPKEAVSNSRYFFIHVKTRFYLKEGYLPFIQLKNTLVYGFHTMLETSDVEINGTYYRELTGANGEPEPCRPDLYMTMTDLMLFLKHYRHEDFEIIDGCWFESRIGLFDGYIEKFKKIKMESKGAKRTLAKLFLNSLYGKMAAGTNSNFKIGVLNDDRIEYLTVLENEKEPGYIPCGAAITSYARCYTITAAQANYHGVEKPGFIYADTDSMHLDLTPDKVKGIVTDDKEFGAWKIESCWDKGLFVRQKTYIEHITEENLTPVERPYYNLKCAGMPERSKSLFIASIEQNYNENCEFPEFVRKKRTMSDLRLGLEVPGKLIPKRITGGIVLTESTYKLR